MNHFREARELIHKINKAYKNRPEQDDQKTDDDHSFANRVWETVQRNNWATEKQIQVLRRIQNILKPYMEGIEL